jgi:hypothetical protein
MPSNVILRYKPSVSLTETLTGAVASVATPTVLHGCWPADYLLNGDTTPKADLCSAFEHAMEMGYSNIDLTNLPGVNGKVIDATGRRLIFLRAIAVSGNLGVVVGARSSSYEYSFGSQSCIEVGGEASFYLPRSDTAEIAVVSEAQKIISLSANGGAPFPVVRFVMAFSEVLT